jgi:AhpD family alkylhydroperoxidase
LRAALEPPLSDLVLQPLSQRFGCSFCGDSHASEARKAGENERRLAALPVWRDTPFFSAPERAALDWAERLTHIRDRGPLEEPYEALRPHFSNRQIAVLTFAISFMNAMNRVAIGFRRGPDPDATS